MTWTQPICDSCWSEREGNRQPFRLRIVEREICCLCGRDTTSGIYFRVNPQDVPYPREERE